MIYVGVHTNMCVLGRSFGIRQMTKLGFNAVLVSRFDRHDVQPAQVAVRRTRRRHRPGRPARRAALVPQHDQRRLGRRASLMAAVSRCREASWLRLHYLWLVSLALLFAVIGQAAPVYAGAPRMNRPRKKNPARIAED